MNPVGLAAALATFIGVWLGHVAVRKIEFVSPTIWIPAALFGTAGLGLEVLALKTTSLPSSAALGILGITLLWDAHEFSRQQRRILKGHAPANPRNPRHARILAASPTATTRDLVKIDDRA
jgi:hypothetical protein